MEICADGGSGIPLTLMPQLVLLRARRGREGIRGPVSDRAGRETADGIGATT